MVDETKETEELEYEINDDDIVAYLVDEDDTEIGFVVMEDGVEVEYYYTEEQLEEDRRAREAAAAKKSGKKNKFDALSNTISRENVKEAAKDMNAIYRDGAEVAREFKSVYDDIMSAFDFSSVGKPEGPAPAGSVPNASIQPGGAYEAAVPESSAIDAPRYTASGAKLPPRPVKKGVIPGLGRIAGESAGDIPMMS